MYVFVNTITSKRVNIRRWKLGVDASYKNLGRVRIWGRSPMQFCVDTSHMSHWNLSDHSVTFARWRHIPSLCCVLRSVFAGTCMCVGRECKIPSLSRRVTAEFIDFMLVFSVKLIVSVIAVEYGFEYVVSNVTGHSLLSLHCSLTHYTLFIVLSLSCSLCSETYLLTTLFLFCKWSLL